ncbi:hypothetical protein WAI453_006658 [Rhynchosporium graminicola]|uniref:Uncharacterized protein n=1 Tax=Rhynchosporium graminicola TaxID=2792576 RepID=A0A1E1K3M4_9HELO|nr:uncharacterized protein RCO7_01833 [Rhynchosporium commune]
MPPARTPQQYTAPSKPVKTERTHEENQERAYIAASRRSDRSLEARVESARRASEIHKRRTGRSLRVTEKDVMDEEMYEEEDDGIPRQYRQLAAHLQTNNPDFNTRLEAYLTANVAMRSALERTIRNSYRQSGEQPYPVQYGNMYPSPMNAHQQQPQQQQYQQPMMQQNMQLPQQQQNTYRQAPYPSPRLGQDGRPASFSGSSATKETKLATSPVLAQGSTPSLLDRRMSMPVTPGTASSPTTSTTMSPLQPTQNQKPSFPQGSFPQQYGMQQQHANGLPNMDMGNFTSFSTALPGNAVGLLGSNFGFNDSSPMMNNDGTFNFGQVNQALPQTASFGKQQHYPSYAGLNSTLAGPATITEEPNLEPQDFFDDAFISANSGATPAQTPGLDGDWNSFVDLDGPSFPSSQDSQT